MKKPVGQQRSGDVLDGLQPVAGGDAGQRQRRDRRRVQLVELLDRGRRRVGRDRSTTADSGTISPLTAAHDRTRPSFSGLFAVLLRHLHDDVVAVGIAVELRDRAAADQQRKRLADVADRQVERRGAVAVDRDRHLRRVEGERVLDDDEPPGRLRLVLDLLGDLEDLARPRRSTGSPPRSAGRRPRPAATAARTRAPRRRPPWRCVPWMSCCSSLLRALALGPVLERPARRRPNWSRRRSRRPRSWP